MQRCVRQNITSHGVVSVHRDYALQAYATGVRYRHTLQAYAAGVRYRRTLQAYATGIRCRDGGQAYASGARIGDGCTLEGLVEALVAGRSWRRLDLNAKRDSGSVVGREKMG